MQNQNLEEQGTNNSNNNRPTPEAGHKILLLKLGRDLKIHSMFWMPTLNL